MLKENKAPQAASSAAGWQIAEGSRGRTRTRQEPPKLLIDLGNEGDNQAQLAWRKHERAKDSISMPAEMVLGTHEHEAIARQHGAFIFSKHRHGADGQMQFDLWGEVKAVAATKQAIYNWLQREAPSKHTLGTTKFVKVQSLTPKLREREEKRWSREVARQRFRQYPPMGMAFGSIVSSATLLFPKTLY